jgi:uncharacterized protein
MERLERIHVSVVYALAERQTSVDIAVEPATTVAGAVEQSGLLRRFPEIAAYPARYAVFNRVVSPGTVVQDGDRVEILRPLLIDPKENRRQAAARARKAARR